MERSKPHVPSPSNGHIPHDGKHRSSSPTSSDISSSTRKNPLKKLASKTKQAAKRAFEPGRLQHEDYHLTQMTQDPAFNPAKLDSKDHSENGLAAKAQKNLQTVAAAILHPKEGFKGKATRSTAGRLSRIERPYISRDMDLELLDAHDNLSRAQSGASSDRLLLERGADSSVGDLTDKVQELEAKRESLRTARTLDRHVQRVRVVPKRCFNVPKEEDFLERSGEGKHAGYDWLGWIGHYMIYYTQDFSTQYIDDFDKLPFDVDTLRLQFERLAIASAPWQAFFMDMREIYRWEDPIKSLGVSLERANDQRSKAFKFGELVDKHGRKHWLEPLLDELGPFIQLQLNDIANMLEVFAK
ncbi:MAG: hypothetical protein Q9168_000754 [Polycauliona sp. 1 TL-2023]